MELIGYGIILRRLTEDKIELVRKWRNNPKIQQYMEYRDFITPEMQKKWFQNINNDSNYYFIIIYKEKEIGLINIKNIDYERKTGESGIFIWDDNFLDTDIPLRASFCLGDFIWNTLKLQSEYIHILRSNKRAINYNVFWGFELIPEQENVENQKYVLTIEKVLQNKEKTDRLKKIICKIDKTNK